MASRIAVWTKWWRRWRDSRKKKSRMSPRSEERRVGKEGRTRGGPDYLKKKKKSSIVTADAFMTTIKRDYVRVSLTPPVAILSFASYYLSSRMTTMLTCTRLTVLRHVASA